MKKQFLLAGSIIAALGISLMTISCDNSDTPETDPKPAAEEAPAAEEKPEPAPEN